MRPIIQHNYQCVDISGQDCGTKFKSVFARLIQSYFKSHWINETLGYLSENKLVQFVFFFYFHLAWMCLILNSCFQIPFGSQYRPVEAFTSLPSGTSGMAAIEGGWIKTASTHWWRSSHCAETEWCSQGMTFFQIIVLLLFVLQFRVRWNGVCWKKIPFKIYSRDNENWTFTWKY